MNALANHTAIALMGHIALFIIVLFILAGLRVGLTLSGKKDATSFSPTGEDAGDFSRRIVRTHANIYENFPVWGGILLLALATGHTEITNGLAMVFLGARVLQSLTHLFSTGFIAVNARFVFFLVQCFIAIYWLYKFFMLALA